MSDPYSHFDLSGRTAVITGGSTGLGYNMARALVKSGARVLISARREPLLKDAADKLNSESWPGEVVYQCVDLSDPISVENFSAIANDMLNGVDIYIGNAALYVRQEIDRIDPKAYKQVFQVNVAANMALTEAFLPHMRSQKWGRIIFSSSASSIAGSDLDGMSVYGASKGAMDSFVRIAAAEAGHDGITVNSIVIGVYLTSMMADYLTELEEKEGKEAVKAYNDGYASMTCNGRIARSDEIEGVVQLFASDAGANITGTNFIADGGLTAKLRPSPPPESPVFPPKY